LTLRIRLLVAAGLLAIALSGIGYSLVATVERSQIHQVDNQLRATVPIGAGLARDNQPPGSSSPGPEARGRGLSDTYVAVITSGARQVLAAPQSAKGQQPALPSLATLSSSALRSQTVNSLQGSTRWRAVLLKTPGGKDVLVGIDISPVDATASDLRIAVIAAGLAFVAILVASGFWVERLGLRPLGQMKEVAEAVVAGDRSRRATESPAKAEAAHLARAFNLMLDQQSAIERQLRQFVSDASHELRTPTAVISGVTELWRQGQLRQGVELDDAMRRTGQAAARMRALVEELLLLARLDEGHPPHYENVDVGDMLHSVEADMQSIFPSRHVEVDLNQSVFVHGDPAALRRVIGNLVTNALVHTPDPSRVAVRVRVRDESVAFEVSDDGPGMEQADAEHAFDRFWRGTASRTRPGTGLGLSIVAAVVKAHGGSVTLDTSPRTGTTVTVVIPAHGPVSAGPRVIRSGRAGRGGSPGRSRHLLGGGGPRSRRPLRPRQSSGG
jgi:two-component system OmpR family sensor kinase